jgi:amino acid adenylation domain-containing protein
MYAEKVHVDTRSLWQTGTLHEPHTEPVIQDWLVTHLARRLGIPPDRLDPHQPLLRYGLDSIVALELVADLEDWLGRSLPLTLIWDYPTIAAIAHYLATSAGQSEPCSESDLALSSVLQNRSTPSEAEHVTLAPLSYGQQALWFLYQQAPDNIAYNIARAARLRIALDIPALRNALQKLVDRHAALRTTFTTIFGKPVQRVHSHMDVCFQEEDATTWSATFLESRLTEEACRPFDLEHGPLLRIHLFKRAPREFVLLLVVHHMVVDFWSLIILLHELGVLYTAALHGTPAILPLQKWQYTDFVHWQADMLQSSEGERLWAYWRQQLAGELPVMQLPTDRPRPPVQTYRGASESLKLGAELTQQLKTLSQTRGTTLFTTLLTAFYVLLHRYTGQEDLLVGSPMVGRNGAEWARLVGYCANPVALRADLSGNPTFEALLEQVRQTVLGAFEHQNYPFALLVERLHVARDPSRPPLCQVMFVLQKAHRLGDQDLTSFALGELGHQMTIGELRLESIPLKQQGAPFDLTLTMAEANGELVASLQYDTALFEAATIKRMLGHFRTLLAGVVADPQRCLAQLPLLTEAERHQLLVAWSGAKARYPQQQGLHQMFESQVERTPEAVAVVCEGQRLTYRELNQRANQLAHYLRTLGVGPEVLVGICVERSLDMVVGILGILKAGGAYVPLDPIYPKERLAFMLNDAQVPVLLAQKRLESRLPACGARVVWLDADWPRIAQHSEANPPGGATAANLAYVIYTSGSTGTPKGVLVDHYNVARLFVATREWFRFDEHDVWSLFHSFAFDFSVWELWGALLHGGRLVIVPFDTSRSPEAFYDLLCQERVTILNQTPSAFRQLMQAEEKQAGLPQKLALRLVIFGGEALEVQSLRPWFARHGDQHPRLVNMYGITETTVHVTYRPLSEADVCETQGSPIGVPIPDLQVYLLNSSLQPVPIGVPGELYVGGAGVARGYLHRPELTAARFIPHPFSPVPGARLYRSGDLARYLPDGSLEFLGRIDQQVKIRGFRVELGEIEAVLRQHPDVREALVLARDDSPGDTRLVAYLVPTREPAPSTEALRCFLKQKLPDYMIPAAFVRLDAIPLTAHGKVDRRALPAPDQGRPHLERAFAAPRTPVEEALVDVWRDVLGIEQIGIDDNFFDLGGDSIRSMQIHVRAQDRGLHFTIEQLFHHQTIRDLARVLSPEAPRPDATPLTHPFDLITPADRLKVPAGVEDAYPLTRLQSEMVTYGQQYPTSAVYHDVFSYHIRARFDQQALAAAMQRLVARHAALRTSFDVIHFAEPLQLVHRTVSLPLHVEDWCHLSTAQQEEALATWIATEAQRPFDLTQPPLLRVQVHRRTAETFQLTLSFHHAILDGWSVASMLTELFQHYVALLEAQSPSMPPSPTATFRDFVAQERKALSSVACQRYWSQHWHDISSSTRFPPCPIVSKIPERPRTNDLEVAIPPRVHAGLERLARAANVPLKSVLLAAHLRVLGLLGGCPDVTTGLVCHGRPEAAGAEKILGLFLNIVPVRLRLADVPWIELVRRAFEAERELLPFRRYPMAPVARRGHCHPMFETVFNFVYFRVYQELQGLKNFEYLGGIFVDPFPYTLKANFILHPFSYRLSCMLNYNSQLFCDEQIQAVGNHYVNVLTAMAGEWDADFSPPALPMEVRRGIGTAASPFPLCSHHHAEQCRSAEALPAVR